METGTLGAENSLLRLHLACLARLAEMDNIPDVGLAPREEEGQGTGVPEEQLGIGNGCHDHVIERIQGDEDQEDHQKV